MKIDKSTLQKAAIELKMAIKKYVEEYDGTLLKEIMGRYTCDERNFLLQYFDRKGYNIEYQKSGIRCVNENLDLHMLKFGYDMNDIPDTGVESVDSLRRQHANEIKKVKVKKSLITYPKTEKMIEGFRIIFSQKIFPNKPFHEIIMYNKVKRLKIAMDKVSENGCKFEDARVLNDIFSGLTVTQRNYILEVFDSIIPGNFKGLRYNDELGLYMAIDKNDIPCKFKYNSLNLRKTKEIIDKWKKAIK